MFQYFWLLFFTKLKLHLTLVRSRSRCSVWSARNPAVPKEFFLVHSSPFLLAYNFLFCSFKSTHCSYNPVAPRVRQVSWLGSMYLWRPAACLFVASHQLSVALLYLLTSMQYKVQLFPFPGIKCGKRNRALFNFRPKNSLPALIRGSVHSVCPVNLRGWRSSRHLAATFMVKPLIFIFGCKTYSWKDRW